MVSAGTVLCLLATELCADIQYVYLFVPSAFAVVAAVLAAVVLPACCCLPASTAAGAEFLTPVAAAVAAAAASIRLLVLWNIMNMERFEKQVSI
jgi:hypothetical protein